MAVRDDDDVGVSVHDDVCGKRRNRGLSSIRHYPTKASIGISCHASFFLLYSQLLLGSVKVSTDVHLITEELSVELHFRLSIIDFRTNNTFSSYVKAEFDIPIVVAIFRQN